MQSKTTAAPVGGFTLIAGSALLLGTYLYLFLGADPVAGVTYVHTSLGLDRLISLDNLFALCHVAVYAALTLLLCTIFPASGTQPAIAAALLGTSIGIEILQEAYFGRNFQVLDVFANMTGIAAAMAILAILAWRSATPKKYL